MSLSGQENVAKFPQTAAMRERFAKQKLESASTFDELIAAIEEIHTFEGSQKIYYAEEVLEDLAVLLSQLADLKKLNQLPVCDLVEFTNALGLRQAIGRLLRVHGYKVSDAVFESD